MNETVFASNTFAEGDRVRYVQGSRLDMYYDRIGTVKAVRKDADGEPMSIGVAFDEGNEMLVWAHVRSWRKLPQMAVLSQKDFDMEKFFTDAAGGPLEVAKRELARLEDRVAELKAAIKVIESI